MKAPPAARRAGVVKQDGSTELAAKSDQPQKAFRLHRPTELASILDLTRYAVSCLQKAGVVVAHGTTDPVAEAAFLVCAALDLHPRQFDDFAAARVAAHERDAIFDMIERRIATREPAAYLVNKAYLRDVPFYVDKRVIVPRSYLAELLDGEMFADGEGALIDLSSVARVLDLCTGSGCLAILAAMQFSQARVDAIDLSQDALDVAARNVAEHGLVDRVHLLRGDLFAPVRGERYDFIIANPPYVDADGMDALPAECRHEPAMAFDGGADGIALVRRIIADAGSHLTEGGRLLCEVGRCRPALEAAYPNLPFLWLDTQESAGEVFWLEAGALPSPLAGEGARTK